MTSDDELERIEILISNLIQTALRDYKLEHVSFTVTCCRYVDDTITIASTYTNKDSVLAGYGWCLVEVGKQDVSTIVLDRVKELAEIYKKVGNGKER